jgi:hypothetical protein
MRPVLNVNPDKGGLIEIHGRDSVEARKVFI